MMLAAVLIWVTGLLTVVPYGTYHLFWRAERDEYALLITLVLFWIFGFWGVVGPAIAVVKARRVFRAIEASRSRAQLAETLRSEEARDVAIDLIASENRIPRFVARRVYRMLATRLATMAEGGRGDPARLERSDRFRT